MRRIVVLAGLLTVATLSFAVSNAAQQPAAAGPKIVEVEKVRDNLYMLKGGGGNTAVFIQSSGITVVDTKNPGWGAPVLAKIKELSPRPVTTIINTHTHGDHVSGNVEFPATVDVVVHENTAANMKKLPIFEQNQGRGLAKKTFQDRMTLGSGADEIDMFYFGRGHTNGDAWVLFPALRVLHTGDIFSGKSLPLLDANNGGSGVEIGDSLAKGHDALNTRADTIITGHSTLMNMNDLREFAQFNRDFLAAVQAAKKAGKTPDDFAKSWTLPAKYSGYAPLQPQAARLLANAQAIYGETK